MRKTKNGQPKKIIWLTMNPLQRKDLEFHWHPAVHMKSLERYPPFVVKRASGCFIEGTDGRRVIDGISSWWCKSLGHNHPRLKAALIEQVSQFEHVIGATTTNETIIALSEKLVKLFPGMSKAFYAGDGSSAIEIALKMSLHSRINRGEHKRTKFLALAHGYHGETCGALSVSHLETFKSVYSPILFDCIALHGIPYLNGSSDPLWNDCSTYWDSVEETLEKNSDSVTALILEPIVQGAGNMRIYSQDFLGKLRAWTKAHNIHLIADEIMTGLGRTGKMFACEHAKITPDFICLSKGLTSGWVPFSAVLTTNDIYDCFYDAAPAQMNPGKETFYHSHTYTGNVLGARLALETLTILSNDFNWSLLDEKASYMLTSLYDVAHETDVLTNIRGIGMIAATDIKDHLYTFEKMEKMIHAAFQGGALLRPLGKTIYWLPPLIIENPEIDHLREITKRALLSVF
jgi:adenosylmethionine---8-amino-7-oxononanoate aminotransferase